jgi:hypothetical protein
MRIAGVLVLACIACAPGVDVVARANTDGGGPAPDATDAPQVCASENMIALVTQSAELYRFNVATDNLPTGGPVTCLGAGVSAVAVDRSGTAWIASSDKLTLVDPLSGECKPRDIALPATAMAFVWDPEDQRERLYAVVDKTLIVVNPSTLARAPIATLALDVRGLVGTNDGRLVAFAGDIELMIGYVDLADGAVAPLMHVKSPEPLTARFVGGALTKQGFDLVFGATLYGVAPTTIAVPRTILFAGDRGLVGVSAPPCTTPAR